ncbi:type II toxin-antitoxin system RelE/ParE family toxin [Photorhabdus bodei]|nr:type II toxin-antitoxin system RelE/ParE family toxin [Photorhabdus bodei]
MVVRSNYVVVYAETTHTVVILRVLHTSRQWPPSNEIKAKHKKNKNRY